MSNPTIQRETDYYWSGCEEHENNCIHFNHKVVNLEFDMKVFGTSKGVAFDVSKESKNDFESVGFTMPDEMALQVALMIIGIVENRKKTLE